VVYLSTHKPSEELPHVVNGCFQRGDLTPRSGPLDPLELGLQARKMVLKSKN